MKPLVTLLLMIYWWKGVESDPLAMVADPLDHFVMFIGHNCSLRSEDSKVTTTPISTTAASIQDCASKCLPNIDCVAVSYGFLEGDPEFKRCYLHDVGCALSYKLAGEEAKYHLLARAVRFPTIRDFFFIPRLHCDQEYFNQQIVASPEECKNLCQKDNCVAFELERVRLFYICTVFTGFRCHNAEFVPHTNAAYYIRRSINTQLNRISDVYKFDNITGFRCNSHLITADNFTDEASLEDCLNVCNETTLCRGFYFKDNRCVMVDTMCTANMYIRSETADVQLLFKQSVRVSGYSVYESKYCDTPLMKKTRLKVFHRERVEDCVNECQMFGCRSLGFQYVLEQNVETERSNTSEDQAESIWYNCVLFKHPCTASLQDSYRRGQYHFIKMVPRVYGFKVYPGVWLRGAKVEEHFVKLEYLCAERCMRFRDCTGFFFAPELNQINMVPCLLYRGKLTMHNAEDSHFNLYMRDLAALERNYQSLIHDKIAPRFDVINFFVEYRKISCTSFNLTDPVLYERFDPFNPWFNEYNIRTDVEWRGFMLPRRRHSVDECRRLCLVDPRCEMALYFHHHKIHQLVNETSESDNSTYNNSTTSHPMSTTPPAPVVYNCFHLPFVCADRNETAKQDLYIKQYVILFSELGAEETNENWTVMNQFRMLEKVICSNFARSLISLPSDLPLNLTLSKCAAVCLDDSNCQAFKYEPHLANVFTKSNCILTSQFCHITDLNRSSSGYRRDNIYIRKASDAESFTPTGNLADKTLYRKFPDTACKQLWLESHSTETITDAATLQGNLTGCAEKCVSPECNSIHFCKHPSCGVTGVPRIIQRTKYRCQLSVDRCSPENYTNNVYYDYYERLQSNVLVSAPDPVIKQPEAIM